MRLTSYSRGLPASVYRLPVRSLLINLNLMIIYSIPVGYAIDRMRGWGESRTVRSI